MSFSLKPFLLKIKKNFLTLIFSLSGTSLVFWILACGLLYTRIRGQTVHIRDKITEGSRRDVSEKIIKLIDDLM